MTGVADALLRLAALFDRFQVVYAVIGGIAVRAYGIPRATYDVDFTVALPRDRLETVFAAAEEIGYSVLDAYRSGWVDAVANMPLVKLRFYLREKGVDADIFLAETPFQESILRRRQRVETDEVTVWLASPEDVILLKLLANRVRDISDVQDILFTQGQLDEAYMRHWAEELGVLPLLEARLSEMSNDDAFP